MKCPKCGCSGSEVLETRGWLKDTMLRRRRLCFNGHRFATYEVPESVAKTMEKYGVPAANTILKRAEIWARHQKVVRAVRAGKQVQEAAAEAGLAANTVSWILKRYAPELTRAGRKK